MTGRFIELADSPEAAAAIEEAAHFHGDLETLVRTVQLVQRGDGASSIEAAALVAQSAGGPADEGDTAPAAESGDSAA